MIWPDTSTVGGGWVHIYILFSPRSKAGAAAPSTIDEVKLRVAEMMSFLVKAVSCSWCCFVWLINGLALQSDRASEIRGLDDGILYIL